MSNDDRQKMEDVRKFSAIYGRFDCKRKPEKPLTLHEVTCNFFCFYNLTRWLLARQIFLKWLIVKKMVVVYFDQLSGAERTRKLVEILFFSRFQPFWFILNLFQFL